MGDPSGEGGAAITADAEVEAVMLLLDTHLTSLPRVSCIAAALREARLLVGRDAATGGLVDKEHGMTWSGALLYLVFCEQIGSCFHLVGEQRSRKEPLRSALVQLGGFRDEEAFVLASLRNRLAHDFTLVEPPSKGREGYAFSLHGSPREPVIERIGRHIMVGLPALTIRLEGLHLSLLMALDEGRLGCHHHGGLGGVIKRFFMHVVTPDDALDASTGADSRRSE